MERVRWGILGPGGIAKAFADGVERSDHAQLVAIASRDASKPGLKETFGDVKVLQGYEALLSDPDVEAIYIATPHPSHAEWTVRALEAGKHVLVEKPIGMNAAEALACIQAAQRAGGFLGEAFMYRLHPQTARLVELIRSGTIGTVRLIRSSFGYALPFDPNHRAYAAELGGGGILDVGCYPVSMARLIAGAAGNAPFLDPQAVFGVGHLGPTGVDEWASAVLRFPNNILAEVSCSVALEQDNTLRILGTMGQIEVRDFWFGGGRHGGVGEISIVLPDGARQSVTVDEPRWLYSFEADAASAAIRAGRGQFDSPGMSWADTLGNMRVLDKWRQDIGLVYPSENAG